MEKFKEMLGNWKTTTLGLIPLVVVLLAKFNVIDITPEQGTRAAGDLFDALVITVSALSSLLGLILKDPKKKTAAEQQ